jgi:hypothetical protein
MNCKDCKDFEAIVKTLEDMTNIIQIMNKKIIDLDKRIDKIENKIEIEKEKENLDFVEIKKNDYDK